MHISCSQPQLLQAVQKVYRAVATTTTLPALTGILFQAQDNMLTLQGTDLDLGIVYSFPVEVLTPGELLLPARIFSEMVRRLPPTNLSLLALPDNTVEITYMQSRVQLNSFDPNQFPSLPDLEGNVSLEVNINTIKDAVRKVSIATSSEDLRSIFSGILLEIEPGGNQFNLVATDTHRLAVYHGQLAGVTSQEPVNALIGSRSLNELARLLPSEEGQVQISIGSSQIFARYENLKLYARLLDGKFPHYRQVIPQSHVTTVKVTTRDLLETTERATLLARDEIKSRSHIIFLQVGETLKITSEAAEVGHLEEELVAQVEGEPLTLALNGRYLLETLRIIDTEEVILEMLAPLKPVVVKPAGEDNYFCLILPVRINTAPESNPPSV
ncbi:DNA polymerase III, beta chain [Moorella glycerini]|uniref:Beta sliding clamp n=1 Tax=Neomoorella stamsii TaxID=1266720 RepID=A0A9X7P6C6_9FIRM|nr:MULTISPECIES: DNA polymerase III subunit beta [Moorella]PRR73099.1 DNA polymerase III subunit beta [Moorella stamsii]CEP67737.1 DNA polymerase III, beta chain [Moorella glycerini]